MWKFMGYLPVDLFFELHRLIRLSGVSEIWVMFNSSNVCTKLIVGNKIISDMLMNDVKKY